ncbi:gas vesicle protein GvpL/GvpF [Actinocorallia herbida]|uniref:Gas vesicle protein GvpL/GvpF n=1 Tax=Actinocorallia herbida TaxID=58109 RepID=A0A3N1CWE0_9ACTN|nr:GvpL/GvpF family gas vesicle protein [Actinocorallia herbida]ROO85584.1 gas vesicle protein GvpL/GvpF [Actinocorallia herbida]
MAEPGGPGPGTPETGWYVYGVGRGLSPDAVTEVRGVGGAPVGLVDEGGITAVVSPVGLAEFGEDPLRRNLESLDWLESTARAHHGVIDALAASAALVPLGLATVYRSAERVRAALRERGPEFAEALDRVGGRTEWGVKVYADPPEHAAPATGSGEAGARPGTSYLRRRQAERHAERDERVAALRAAEEIDAALRDTAVDGRRHRAQDPGLSGERGWMVLNAAYLVDDSGGARFRDSVAAEAARHPRLRVRITGPWAPYSFAVAAREGP